MSKSNSIELDNIVSQPYKYGFATDIETENFPTGLNESIISQISSKKNEPRFVLEFRLQAYKRWLGMETPDWAKLEIPEIDYQEIQYYSVPKKKKQLDSLNEVDPELLETFNKLGISLNEQKRISNVAVDAIFDSVSVGTTFKDELYRETGRMSIPDL